MWTSQDAHATNSKHFFFETGSCYVVLSGLEFAAILLPLLTEFGGHRHEPSFSALVVDLGKPERELSMTGVS